MSAVSARGVCGRKARVDARPDRVPYGADAMKHPLLQPSPGQPLRILAIGAHSDDIEIGAGATLLRLVESGVELEVCWAVLTADEDRETEARSSAAELLGPALTEIVVGRLRESYLPYVATEAKDFIHSLRDRIEPDLIFTHCQHDLHQDHRIVAELVSNAFRDHLILGFEIPKYDGDLGSPNVFFEVSEEHVQHKVALLHKHFPSQATKFWFDERLFVGLARIRGVESRSSSGLAEGFYCRKVVF